jgi:hypothetical protein
MNLLPHTSYLNTSYLNCGGCTMQSATSVSVVRSEQTRARFASWQQIVPGHRLPVVTKTLVLIALGVYVAGGSFATPQVWLTMAFAAALWAVLYTLNEATDKVIEEGLIVAPIAWGVLLGLPAVLCLWSLRVSPLLGLYLSLMFLGQWAYCARPLRLKRYWWAILILSGAVNPMLRFACGALWGTRSLSLLVCLVVVSLHIGATLRARLLQRERDKQHAYSVVAPWSAWVGKVCTATGFVGAYILCWQRVLPLTFAVFITFGAGYSIYAWSDRAKSMTQLRRGWLGFALIAIGAIIALLYSR